MSKEILEEIAQAKKQAQMQMQQDEETLQSSTDEEEIQEALLRKKDAMGMGPEEPEVEGG